MESLAVLLLDLDGTIVGPIDHLVSEREVHAIVHGKKSVAKLRAAVISRLRHGIVRPHFREFMLSTPNEKFIYTAGTHEWASFIVPCIEAACGVKFNRPLFTRDDLVAGDNGVGGGRKSIAHVRPAVARALKRKHKLATAPDLEGRIILVDNTPGVLVEDRFMVRCPTYGYVYAFDVLAALDPEQLHAHHEAIAQTLDIPLPLTSTSSSTARLPHLLAAYYARLAREARMAAAPDNVRQRNRDRFWQVLAVVFQKLRDRARSARNATRRAQAQAQAHAHAQSQSHAHAQAASTSASASKDVALINAYVSKHVGV